MYLWKSYLASIKKSCGQSQINNISFRSKKYGWHEYCIDFHTNQKNIYSKKVGDPFFDIFFGADIMNEACYDCKARSSMAYTDIRIGDFWGAKYDLDDKGVSAVVICTQLGAEVLNSIKEKISINSVNFDEIISAQSYGKIILYNETRRKFLIQNITEYNDIIRIHQQYIKMLPPLIRVKKFLKERVKYLPKPLYFTIRKIIHFM